MKKPSLDLCRRIAEHLCDEGTPAMRTVLVREWGEATALALEGYFEPQSAAPDAIDIRGALAAQPSESIVAIAAYFYQYARSMWERTYQHESIEQAMSELSAVLLPRCDSLSKLLLLHGASLIPLMRLEAAQNAGCVLSARECARDGLRRASVLQDLTERSAVEAPDCPVVDRVRLEARANKAFLEIIEHVAARMVDAFISTARTPALRAAAAAARAAKEDGRIPEGDFYLSELQSQAEAAERMADRLESGQVFLDRATIIFLYPMHASIDALVSDPEGRATICKALAADLGVDVELRPNELTDIWEGSFPTKDRPGGWRIDFKPWRLVEGISYEGQPTRIADAALVLDPFSGHRLELSWSIHEAEEATLFRELRRGTGEDRITHVDAESFKLSETGVVDAVEQVNACLAQLSPSSAPTAEGRGMGSDVRTSLLIEGGVVQRANAPERPLTSADLKAPWFPKVPWAPVGGTAISLADWALVGQPSRYSIVSHPSIDSVLVVPAVNLITAFVFSVPQFFVMEIEDMIRFVQANSAYLEDYLVRLDANTERLGSELEMRDGSGGSADVELLELEIELQSQVIEVRRYLSKLRARGLCRSETHRVYLDRMLDASRVASLEREVLSRLEELAATRANIRNLRQVHEQSRQKRERSAERRTRRLVESLLAALALLSVVDLLSFGNEAVRQGDLLMMGELGLLALVLAVVARYLLRGGN